MVDSPAMSDLAAPPLRGRLEQVTRTLIAGWAMDPGGVGEPVMLELLIDGAREGMLPARLYREDLEKAGIGDGCHAFQVTIPHGLAPDREHVVRIRHAGDGRELPGSPFTLPPEPGAEPVADALAADPAGRDALLASLVDQAARLLLAQGTAMPEPAAARLARFDAAMPGPADPRPQALLIDEGIPAAGRDAGSSAALSHLKSLQRLGYRVHAVAAFSIEPAGERTRALAELGVTCWHAPWIGSVEEVLRRLGPVLKLVYVHRFGTMQRYGALVRRWAPEARLVYSVADLHHLRAARRIAVEAGLPPDAPEGAEAAAGLRAAELMAVLGADAVITHSSHEAALLRRDAGEAAIHLVPWDVPVVPAAPVAGRRGVAFVGSYGHAPNLDAAHLLLEEVMPLVWAAAPDIPLLLAGSDLPATLREAAASHPAARVLGWVPALGEVLGQARLTAAPLRYGAGLKGKVLDSLAAGLPCLCSPMAAEGMDLPAALAPLVHAGSKKMAAAILRLHQDDRACAELAASGQAWIAETFSTARIDALLAPAVLRD
jgi:glycosyltransferase involved in cell wall biosynthesis